MSITGVALTASLKLIKMKANANSDVAATKTDFVTRIFIHTEFKSTESNHKYFVKKVAIALATENPIIATKTRKDNPLLSLPVFVPPILTMVIYYLSPVFNVNYTAK